MPFRASSLRGICVPYELTLLGLWVGQVERKRNPDLLGLGKI